MSSWHESLLFKISETSDIIKVKQWQIKQIEEDIAEHSINLQRLRFQYDNLLWKELMSVLKVEDIIRICLSFESRQSCGQCHQYKDFPICLKCELHDYGTMPLFESHATYIFSSMNSNKYMSRSAFATDLRYLHTIPEDELLQFECLLQCLPPGFEVSVRGETSPWLVSLNWDRGGFEILISGSQKCNVVHYQKKSSQKGYRKGSSKKSTRKKRP
jgi:hypothetical protein